MDILGPLPITSAGNRYLLVVIDCFTKWVEACPLKNIKANTIADFCETSHFPSWNSVREPHRSGKEFRIEYLSRNNASSRN